MSKTKNKTHNELEHLRGEIKKLKSLVRQLRKKNKQLEKKSHFYEDVVDETVEDVKLTENCPNCQEGVLQVLDFPHVILTKCSECDYRKSRKPK